MKRYSFILIILLAILVRILFIGQIPPGVTDYEATLGWRVQNLLEFGKDEFGREYPFIFSNRRDLELPLITYISLPFIFMGPNNVLWLRLPFAIAGVLLVAGMIYLTRRLLPSSKNLDLLVGLLVAVNPWSLLLSRVVSAEIVAVTLVVWGCYFFLGNKKEQFLGVIFLCLSLITSKIVLLFLPLILIYLFLRNKNPFLYIPEIVVYLIVCVLIFVTPGGFKSLLENDFSLVLDHQYLDHINLNRGMLNQNGLVFLGGLLFNKLLYLVRILSNFIDVFSFNYLFTLNSNILYKNLTNFNPFLLCFLPFFILGILDFFKKRSSNYKLLLVWLVGSTLPVLFLVNSIATNRFIFSFIPLTIFVAIGLLKLKKRWWLFFSLILTLNFFVVAFNFASPSRTIESSWNPQTSKIADYIKKYPNQKIWLSDNLDPNPGPTLAYFLQIPYDKANLNKEFIYKAWVGRIGDISIGNLSETDQKWDMVITTLADKDKFNCSQEINQIGEGKNIYLISKDCMKK
jgi:hypothetical protein